MGEVRLWWYAVLSHHITFLEDGRTGVVALRGLQGLYLRFAW